MGDVQGETPQVATNIDLFKSFYDGGWLTKLTKAEAVVWMALWRYRNSHRGFCWPKLDRLARETGIERRNLRRLIHKLESLGLVETLRQGSGRRTSMFWLVVPGASSSWLGEGVMATPPEGVILRREGVMATPSGGVMATPRKSKGKSNELKARAKALPVRHSFDCEGKEEGIESTLQENSTAGRRAPERMDMEAASNLKGLGVKYHALRDGFQRGGNALLRELSEYALEECTVYGGDDFPGYLASILLGYRVPPWEEDSKPPRHPKRMGARYPRKTRRTGGNSL